MIGLLAASSVETVMGNHYYTIGGTIRKQEEGGAIGSDMTGEVTRDYMILWDEKLIELCKTLGITLDLYDRYVDDDTIVTRAIGKGWYYCSVDKRMKFSFEQEILEFYDLF